MTTRLGLDPGKATGWAIAQDGALRISGVLSWSDTASLFLKAVAAGEPALSFFGVQVDEIVMERFIITERTMRVARQMEPLYCIGVVVAVAAWFGVPVVFQTAADAKKTATDARLKEMGWYVTGTHARDAVRHLVTRLIRERVLGPKELRGEG